MRLAAPGVLKGIFMTFWRTCFIIFVLIIPPLSCAAGKSANTSTAAQTSSYPFPAWNMTGFVPTRIRISGAPLTNGDTGAQLPTATSLTPAAGAFLRALIAEDYDALFNLTTCNAPASEYEAWLETHRESISAWRRIFSSGETSIEVKQVVRFGNVLGACTQVTWLPSGKFSGMGIIPFSMCEETGKTMFLFDPVPDSPVGVLLAGALIRTLKDDGAGRAVLNEASETETESQTVAAVRTCRQGEKAFTFNVTFPIVRKDSATADKVDGTLEEIRQLIRSHETLEYASLKSELLTKHISHRREDAEKALDKFSAGGRLDAAARIPAPKRYIDAYPYVIVVFDKAYDLSHSRYGVLQWEGEELQVHSLLDMNLSPFFPLFHIPELKAFILDGG